MRRGFSLTELLIVVLIIGLVAALIFPIFTRAKDASKTVPCTSNLRQIYVAWSNYLTECDGEMPPSLVQLNSASRGLGQVLACPADTTPGANPDVTAKLGKTSYFSLLPDPGFRAALLSADPNHGILYCVLHGERVPGEFPDGFRPVRDTNGLVLRLRRDGSIQRAQVGYMCGPKRETGQMVGRSAWGLVSDTKCVEPYCYGLTIPCKG